MKRLSIGFLILTILVFSCRKNNETGNTNATSGSTQSPVIVAPTSAKFKIKNAPDPAAVWEAVVLDFENTSQNANSYQWDLGNGTVSTDMTPANFSYGTCGMEYTITLTAKNTSGQTATYSASYFVRCSRGMNTGRHTH